MATRSVEPSVDTPSNISPNAPAPIQAPTVKRPPTSAPGSNRNRLVCSLRVDAAEGVMGDKDVDTAEEGNSKVERARPGLGRGVSERIAEPGMGSFSSCSAVCGVDLPIYAGGVFRPVDSLVVAVTIGPGFILLSR